VALTVVRDPVTGVSFTAVPGQRAYLLTESGSLSFTFRFAPPVIAYESLEQEWVQVSRVGLVPLLVRKADKLDTLKFSINMGGKDDFYEDQGGYTDSLRAIAKSRERIMFRYSDHEAGLWRITALSISSAIRHPVSTRMIRASAEITLTRASEPALSVGPVSSPVNPQPLPQSTVATPAGTYVVAQGDTLWGISDKFYGRGDRWPVIYDANRDKIQTPWLLQPGWQLIIPPS
jgi:nucleoid-associated protein YgaU